MLLPPATKLGQGYVFTGVCDSVHRGEYLTRYTPQTRYTLPRTRYPPGPGTSPQTRYTPLDQVHFPMTGTCPRTRYTPLGPGTPPRPGTLPPQTPRTRYTPQTRYTPRGTACWEIRSMRGRYASYWNVILFIINFYFNFVYIAISF